MTLAETKTRQQSRAGHRFIEGTLSVPLLQFDLTEEIAQQRQEDSWLGRTGRSSNTLVKHPDLRIVLISMKANTRMHEHKSTGRISVQTIAGHIQFRLPDRTVDLPASRLLVLDKCLPHEVEALEDSAFLLTFSWPPEREIQDGKSRTKRKVRHDQR